MRKRSHSIEDRKYHLTYGDCIATFFITTIEDYGQRKLKTSSVKNLFIALDRVAKRQQVSLYLQYDERDDIDRYNQLMNWFDSNEDYISLKDNRITSQDLWNFKAIHMPIYVFKLFQDPEVIQIIEEDAGGNEENEK